MASDKAKELVSSNTVVVFRIVRNLANFYGFEGLICQIYCPLCVDVKKLLTELNASFKAIEIDREILQTSSIVRIVINTRTMNSSYNVSTSTLRVMTEQFLFGNRICEELGINKALFEPYMFFESYRNYLQVDLAIRVIVSCIRVRHEFTRHEFGKHEHDTNFNSCLRSVFASESDLCLRKSKSEVVAWSRLCVKSEVVAWSRLCVQSEQIDGRRWSISMEAGELGLDFGVGFGRKKRRILPGREKGRAILKSEEAGLLTGGYSGGGLRRSSCMFFVRLRQLTLMGYVAFGRFDDFNYFVAGSERYNFVQEFYNGDLQHCEITHDKRGRTAQVNIICGDCPNGRCKGGLACVCDVTLESDCRIVVELAIPCEKPGVQVFEGFTVGFHPRSWEIVRYFILYFFNLSTVGILCCFDTDQNDVSLYMTVIASFSHLVKKPSIKVFPDTGLAVTLSGSGAIGTPPTTLSPTLLDINWRSTIFYDLRKIKEEVLLKKDPETLSEGGWCFGQSKKRQTKDTMNLVIKKRKEYEEKMKEKGEAPVMFRCVWCCFNADLVNLSCFEVT
ncbi:hypothetical protein LXL04_008645 [Taraxacum kok-saghyz]